MAFSFGTGGTPSSSLFGATATTTSSGFGFGTATTTPSSGFSFGGGAPSFGTPASSATTGFGTGTNTGTGTTGFSFGQPTSTGTGFAGFGTPAASTSASTTGFGSFGSLGTGTSSGFGTGSSTAFGTGSTTGFGTGSTTGFGTGSTTGFGTGSTTGFGTGSTTGFGTGSTTGFGTGSTTGFGTGSTTGFGTGSTTGFGTGSTTGFGTGSTTGFGTGSMTGFGTGSTTGFGTGSMTGFGTGSTTGFGTGSTTGFGTGSTTGFGTGSMTGFGTGSTTGFGTGSTLFGTGSTTNTLGGGGGGGGLFGLSTQQQQPQPGSSDALANIALAVSLLQIYGDERDVILAKWNQLQAFWGTGHGYYSQNGAVDFKPDNPFCRFKAIGYSVVPSGRNEDGLVSLQLKLKLEEVVAMQQQIVDGLNSLLPNKQTQSVCVEGVRPLPGNVAEFVVYVLERPTSGPAKRIPAMDLAAFLNNVKGKLGPLNVSNILPKIGWSPEQLKEYLATPPAGLDPSLWQQAKLDNPDAEKLIPVPMIGFKELQQRFQHQVQQTRLHQQRLDVMSEDLNELQSKHGNMLAKLDEYKRKHLELSHRLLQVIVKQEVYRKTGYAIQAEEEQQKVQLEAIQAELNHPTQFKGRLNELMSQIRMQNQLSSGRPEVPYQMEENLQAEMKQMLMQQQQGLQHLIQILRQDSEDIKLMEQGLALEATRR